MQTFPPVQCHSRGCIFKVKTCNSALKCLPIEADTEVMFYPVHLIIFLNNLLIFLPPYLPAEEESEESSSGEVEIEPEVSSDPEDPRELHPGALLHRSSRLHNLPLMAEALAHGADVHAASEEEGKTPLIQAVMGVRHYVCLSLLFSCSSLALICSECQVSHIL